MIKQGRESLSRSFRHIIYTTNSRLLFFLVVLLSTTAAMAMTATPKPRILCLHGRCQSGSILRNKIAGARRKLEKSYDLTFLDGPLRLEDGEAEEEPQFAWFERTEDHSQHLYVREALEYVIDHCQSQNERPYDALLGFSQGGVVATALCLTGKLPTIQAVVTAGAPMNEQAFLEAKAIAQNDESVINRGLEIPKFHLAGVTDAMVSVESTQQLCEADGSGILIQHEKGHLFPTKALYTNQMMEFLQQHVK